MYKNLLIHAMYSRLERAPQLRLNHTSPQWNPSAMWPFLSLKKQNRTVQCSAVQNRLPQFFETPFIESHTQNLDMYLQVDLLPKRQMNPIYLEISGVVSPPSNLIVESVLKRDWGVWRLTLWSSSISIAHPDLAFQQSSVAPMPWTLPNVPTLNLKQSQLTIKRSKRRCLEWTDAKSNPICWKAGRCIVYLLTSTPSLYTARNSQTSSYEAFSNNVFSIQAHQARVHQRLILAPSHDTTHLARLVQNPYKVMCSKCAVTLFARNAQCFLIAAKTYPSQRHARTSRTLPRYPLMTNHTIRALRTVHNICMIPCTQNMHLCCFLETRSVSWIVAYYPLTIWPTRIIPLA